MKLSSVNRDRLLFTFYLLVIVIVSSCQACNHNNNQPNHHVNNNTSVTKSIADESNSQKPKGSHEREEIPSSTTSSTTTSTTTTTTAPTTTTTTTTTPKPTSASTTSTSTTERPAEVTPDSGKTSDKVLICYYGTWAVYRPGSGKFAVENIDPHLCTHVIYSFAGLGYDNTIKALDPWNDLPDNYGKGAYIRFVDLKKVNPRLKTLIAIGGWNEGSIKYSNMAGDPSARATFVSSVMAFLEKYNFDGLDVDWEYPASRGGKPEDRSNFALLLKDLSSAFKPKGYLLTAAVSAGKWNIDPAYDVPKVSEYLDYINVMCYDYHGGWEDKTGHNAPLYARPVEVANERLNNVNFSVNYWLSQGASRSKLVVGMATYGRSFTLAREQDNGLGEPAPQKGQAGPYTREAGSLGYNEICESQLKTTWTIVRDPHIAAPYAFSGRQWVGYDDVESIVLKTRLVNQMGLAGAMVWSLETDDFLGNCGPTKFPLIKAIKGELVSGNCHIPDPKVARDEPTREKVTPSSSSSSTTTVKSTSSFSPSSSTTTTTTTTIKPITSTKSTKSLTSSPSDKENEATDNSDEMICKSSGMFRNPRDCKKFYRCVEMGSRFYKYDYVCPTETVFDSETQICIWPDSVPECRNYYSQNEIAGSSLKRA